MGLLQHFCHDCACKIIVIIITTVIIIRIIIIIIMIIKAVIPAITGITVMAKEA